MATKLNFEVTINRPVEKVFAFATDPANSAKWQSGLIESKMTTPGPMGVGSKITDVRTFVGQRLESTIEVTEFEPNKKRTFKSAGGPIKFMATETYEAVVGGTKITVAVEMEPGGFFKIAEGMVASSAKKDFDASNEKLKQLLESM